MASNYCKGSTKRKREQQDDPTNCYPSKRESGYGSIERDLDVIEIDSIFAQNPENVYLHSPPPNMPINCPDNLPTVRSRLFFPRKPDQTDSLIVQHPLSTDCELGDYFGATCETYIDKEFNCHKLKDVDPRSNTPAAVMKIMDKDELIFINDVFAPAKSHISILNIFHHVKVDGKTPFKLIIRRKAGKKSWQWYESTAILVPDPRKIPYAERATFGPVANNYREWTGIHRYRVDACLGLYLCIEGSTVSTRLLQHNDNDITTVIIKKSSCGQGTGDGYIYYCRLLSHDGKTSLSVDSKSKTLVVGKNEQNPWQWQIDDGKIYFKSNELFLGFEDNKVTCTSRCYMFEEFSASIGQDQCDYAGSSTSLVSVDRGYSSL